LYQKYTIGDATLINSQLLEGNLLLKTDSLFPELYSAFPAVMPEYLAFSLGHNIDKPNNFLLSVVLDTVVHSVTVGKSFQIDRLFANLILQDPWKVSGGQLSLFDEAPYLRKIEYGIDLVGLFWPEVFESYEIFQFLIGISVVNYSEREQLWFNTKKTDIYPYIVMRFLSNDYGYNMAGTAYSIGSAFTALDKSMSELNKQLIYVGELFIGF